MKKKNFFRLFLAVIFIHLCVCVFSGFSPSAVVADDGKKVDDTVEEMLHTLDLKELEAYLNKLGLTNEKTLVQRLMEYVKVESFDFATFGEDMLNVLFARVKELLPAFLCIIGVALLSGVLSSLHTGNGNTVSEVVFIICYVGALLPLLVVVGECFQTTVSGIVALQKQMQIMYPLLLTLMAVSGGNVTASVCRPAVAFFSTGIVSVLEGVVLPITGLIILFSLASNLTKDLKINKFSAFFKSINKWIIGLCVSVFGIFFTLQGITAITYDGVVRRATKYAIGNGIPIVGGFLSGGFDLAVAGSVLIKNSLGNMSIFLMLFVLLEPILLMVAVNILLRLSSAITNPFGDSRISDFLSETADNLQYCTASLLFTGFLYFLSILLFVAGSEALL